MRIKDICDINAFSISVNDEIDNIQYLDTSNLTENKIGELQSMLLSEAPSRAQRRVKNNTILYSTVRPNQKHYGILSNPCHNLIVSTGFATLDIKESLKNEYDAHFLYYLLTQNWVTLHLQTLAENSVSSYPSINASDIGNLDFSFPIIEVQRQLASILKNIDDKIVLNRSINRNLPTLDHSLKEVEVHHVALSTVRFPLAA
jgi:type I restriction enzyme S subunit